MGELVKSQQNRALLSQYGLNPDGPLQLPLWQDVYRVMPNDFSRSALFTVKNKRTPRKALQGVLLYHYNNDVEIEFTGLELRADDDELVWQQVLNYAKHFPLGTEIKFTSYELCKDLGWPTTGYYYKRIEDCLTRLKANAINFRSKRLQQLESFSLLDKFRMEQINSRRSVISVVIDPVIIKLFMGDNYTKNVWAHYRQLSPIARRLYDYLASHREPYPLKLDVFRQICASDCERAKKWREMTKDACTELEKSTLVVYARVEDDKVIGSRYGAPAELSV